MCAMRIVYFLPGPLSLGPLGPGEPRVLVAGTGRLAELDLPRPDLRGDLELVLSGEARS